MMSIHYWTSIWIAIGIITFLFLIFKKVRAPYGRHSSTSWGPMIDNKWGWVIMELPALLVFPVVVCWGPYFGNPLIYMLVFLWVLHYINRTIIFPLRIKTKGKKMPLLIVISAILFNMINGFLNGYYLGFLPSSDISLGSWNVILGTSVFLIGMYINIRSDNKLIQLRAKKQGYQIPRKWLFDYISCPNHFGEIIEWIGFAIIAWNYAALSFAIWTFCNLVPRALNHHHWYHESFEEYPKDRKAVIPFLW